VFKPPLYLPTYYCLLLLLLHDYWWIKHLWREMSTIEMSVYRYMSLDMSLDMSISMCISMVGGREGRGAYSEHHEDEIGQKRTAVFGPYQYGEGKR